MENFKFIMLSFPENKLLSLKLDFEFLLIADLLDQPQEIFDLAMENFEEVAFDVFNFYSVIGDKSFQYMVHKIF